MSIPKIYNTYAPELINFNCVSHKEGKGYFIEDKHTKLIRVVLLFNSGSYYQDQPLMAQIFSSLLTFQTEQSSHFELNQRLESLGLNLSVDAGKDDIEVELILLEEYFAEALQLLQEIIFQPSFSREGYDQVLGRLKSEYLIKKEKGAVVAQRELIKTLFQGTKYGVLAEDEDFERDLLPLMDGFHQKFKNSLSLLVVTGFNAERRYSEVAELVEDLFNPAKRNTFNLRAEGKLVKRIYKPNAEQDSIRIASPAVGWQSKDYPMLTFANLVFGGYHSARLMHRLREELGLTYGAYSSIVHHVRCSHIQMSMDIQKGSADQALREIEAIIARMQKELVQQDELEKSRAFLLGNLLQGFDGAFDQMDQVIICHKLGVDYRKHFSLFFDYISKAKPTDLQEIYNKYYQWDRMYKVVVSGSK